MVAEKRPVILTLIKPLMTNPTADTAEFLYQLLKTLSSGEAENIGDLEWRDLPLILKTEEIFDSELTHSVYLKEVKVTGKYQSTEDYIDVYFRLLREDCFYRRRLFLQLENMHPKAAQWDTR